MGWFLSAIKYFQKIISPEFLQLCEICSLMRLFYRWSPESVSNLPKVTVSRRQNQRVKDSEWIAFC